MAFHPDWMVPDWPAPPGVRAVFSTLAGGHSEPPYASLNLGRFVGDDAALVQRNRQALNSAMGASANYLRQVHGVQVVELKPPVAIDDVPADGAFSRHRGLVCTVMVADCLPILLCDNSGTWVAALHAGWRGLAGLQGDGIIEAFFKQLVAESLINSAQAATDLIAWLGPCIGPKAFEVGPEVRAAFLEHSPQAEDAFVALPSGKWLAHLPLLARQRLQSLGITRVYGNDGSAPWCTVSNPLRFFSFRRDHVCGRHAACIWLE
jgi:YfiH family protein